MSYLIPKLICIRRKLFLICWYGNCFPFCQRTFAMHRVQFSLLSLPHQCQRRPREGVSMLPGVCLRVPDLMLALPVYIASGQPRKLQLFYRHVSPGVQHGPFGYTVSAAPLNFQRPWLSRRQIYRNVQTNLHKRRLHDHQYSMRLRNREAHTCRTAALVNVYAH